MRLSQRIACLAIALLLLIGGGCQPFSFSEPVYREDVIGDYAANFDIGLVDSLRLNEDSSYVRWFMGEDSILFVDTGFWRMQDLRVPNDSLHISILFPEFVTRYNITLGDQTVFSMLPVFTTDTVPGRMELEVFKSDSLSQDPIMLGRRLGMAYLKVRRKRE